MLPSQEKPWLKYYKPEFKDMKLPEKTMYRLLMDETKGFENVYAIDYYGNRYTYGTLIEKVEDFANKYKALGVKKGDKVVFLCVNLPEVFASFYALNKIGAIPVLVEPRMAKERIEYFIKMVKAEYVVMLDLVYPKVVDIIAKLGVKKVLVVKPTSSLPPVLHLLKKMTNLVKKNGKIRYNDVYMRFADFKNMQTNEKAEEVPFEKGAVGVITQTGGTTGQPKGVMLTNEGLNAVALGFRYSQIPNKPGDRFLNIMPIFTSYGVVCGLHLALINHADGILIPDFTPKKFPGLMKKYEPAIVIGVPSFYESLLKAKELKDADFSKLIFAVSGGDLMNPELEKDLNKFFADHGAKTEICQGYGLSETSAVTAFGHVYREGSEGLPICTSTMGIFNPETNEELPYNTQGEICVRGPSIMKGYFDNAEETAGVLKVHADGHTWVHSGDLGYFDEDGFLFFSGRIKFVIPRYDGHKNFPVQIEAVVAKHPMVRNCCCVACKDMTHKQGKWPLVVVELETVEGIDEEATRKDIKRFCKKYLEERGQPIDVVIDTIPKTLIGKNDVVSLLRKYENYDYKNAK